MDLSIMTLLLGLFSTDLLAKEMSAVTLVIDILKLGNKCTEIMNTWTGKVFKIKNALKAVPHLPSNLCFRKSKSAFCIISVTCVQTHEDRRVNTIMSKNLILILKIHSKN